MSSPLTLSSMTWEEVDALDRSRTVALLPVGATEAHGPHLPLATDVIIAQAMARAAAIPLAQAGWRSLLLPPLAYAPAPFAASFPGTISIAPATMTALVLDIARSLAASGFRALAIANSHLDPAHTAALHAAAAAAPGEGVTIVYPDITRRPWGSRLTDEFRSGAAHAGRYESSIVLAEEPALVREDVRVQLAAVEASLSHAIRNGVTTFTEAGGERAYFGDPAAATADEGATTVSTLGGILADAILAEVS